MGGKQSRRGKHFYISAAGLILSLLLGCAAAGDLIPWGGRDGQCCCLELFEEGGAVDRERFNAALSENLDRLSGRPDGRGMDEALFRLGLIYSHPENPARNFEQARRYFEMLVARYPESCLEEQAGIWISVLDVIEKSKQVDIDIEEKKKELEK